MKVLQKTRALRKYEAGPLIATSADGPPRMDFFSPFGPMIAKVTLPARLVAAVNIFADSRASSDKSSEFYVPPEVAFAGGEESLARHTERLIARYVEGVEGSRVKAVRIEIFWIVSQYAGSPSPVHFHSGDISGVAYLKVPEIADEGAEEAKTYISGRQAGYINFMIGGKQNLSKSLISFKPAVGDFYIFPGWLLHGAEPFRGEGERRSMAFNAYVEYADS
jgi:hypothetical protein